MSIPSLAVGQRWICRDNLHEVLIHRCKERQPNDGLFTGDEFPAGETRITNSWFYHAAAVVKHPTKASPLGWTLGSESAGPKDLVRLIETIEISVIPIRLQAGQVWQCRDQRYRGKVLNDGRTVSVTSPSTGCADRHDNYVPTYDGYRLYDGKRGNVDLLKLLYDPDDAGP